MRSDFREDSGISCITALRAASIQKLAADGALQLSLFDTVDLAGIAHPDYPGERLVVCFNPVLSQERGRKREDLLQATEKELERITKQTTDELPVHSFQRLLADLATRTLNRVQPTNQSVPPFNKFANPTLLQHRAFDLLEIRIQPPAA